MSLNTNRSETPANDVAELEREPANQEKIRLCLVCETDFASSWAGERVCKKCRSSSKWRQG